MRQSFTQNPDVDTTAGRGSPHPGRGLTGRGIKKMTAKRKQHPPPGDDASTAEAAPGTVGIDEQGKARQVNTTPNGGPHLELLTGRLRLKA